MWHLFNFTVRTHGGQAGGSANRPSWMGQNSLVRVAPRVAPNGWATRKAAITNTNTAPVTNMPIVPIAPFIYPQDSSGGGGGGTDSGGYDNSQQPMDDSQQDTPYIPMDNSSQPVDDSGVNSYPNTPDDGQDTDNFNDVPTTLDTNTDLETKSIYTNDIYHADSKPVNAPAYDYLKGEVFPIKGVLKIYNSAYSVGDKSELHNTFFGGGDFLIEDVKYFRGNVICQVIVKNTYTGWCFFNETGIKLSNFSFENLSTDNENTAEKSLPDPDTIVDTLQADKYVFDSPDGKAFGKLSEKSYLGEFVETQKDSNGSDSLWYHYKYGKYPNIGLQMGILLNPDNSYWFLAEPDEISGEPIRTVGLGLAKGEGESLGTIQDGINGAINSISDATNGLVSDIEDIFILILLLVAAYIAYKVFVK